MTANASFDRAGLAGQILFGTFLFLVWLSWLLVPADYYRCPKCGAAYKQYWYQGGLPGQCKYECGACGTKLRQCSAEESGWVEGQEPSVYGR